MPREALSRRELLLGPIVLTRKQARPPNVIVILTDDQGYADLGCYGAQDLSAPNIDRMAAEGVRFTDFYSAASICSPARAALLSGCYPQRISITKVLGPNSVTGIHPEEQLLSELLKARGYRTALYGKWHLGRQPEFLPLRHGFDEFFGTPGSNDMGSNMDVEARRRGRAGVELIEGEKVVEIDPDQRRLTARYTERALRFIRANRRQPFFLYVAPNMPHTPLFVSDLFRGKSKRGLYGDVISEIDWAVGEILQCLRQEGLASNTLVFFSSDNGPWLIFGDHGGSATPLRGGKREVWEGGFRVPGIFWWPGRIPPGRTCSEVATLMDVLPTIVRLAGSDLPKRTIDGKDIWPLLSGAPGARSPHKSFYYYYDYELRGCRSGRWKLVLPHIDNAAPDPTGIGSGGVRGAVRRVRYTQALFDLLSDPGESTDVSQRNPSVVEQFSSLIDWARRELGDSLTNRLGEGVRPCGTVVGGR